MHVRTVKKTSHSTNIVCYVTWTVRVSDEYLIVYIFVGTKHSEISLKVSQSLIRHLAYFPGKVSFLYPNEW